MPSGGNGTWCISANIIVNHLNRVEVWRPSIRRWRQSNVLLSRQPWREDENLREGSVEVVMA